MFDDRSIDAITDDELHDLVTGAVSEQQRIEFKSTLRLSSEKQQADKEKLELLLDVTSMANGGGGYIIFGVKDDGRGRTAGYFGLSLADAKKIENIIEELSVVHISERIEGLEVRLRTLNLEHLVIVRLPASSKTPHMVTFNGSTIFQTRHDDSKRKMTIGEIRSAFNDDLFGRRLSRVEQELSQLLQFIKQPANGSMKNLSEVTPAEDGALFSEMRRKEVWQQHD